MSKKEIRQSLIDTITEFGNLEGWTKSDMEKIAWDEDRFYTYVENHDDLKYHIYLTFRQIFDDYIKFRFYNDPIPALEDDPNYMEQRKEDILKEAKDFFNYGGLK